jgi:hypothetical protein
VLVQGWRDRQSREGLDELRHVGRVDVRVRRLVDRHGGNAVAEFGIVEPRMVVTDRAGSKVGEEIENGAAAAGIEEPRAFRPGQIHDDFVAVGEHVPREHVVNIAGLDVDAPVRDCGN